jgi:hypothetical protein
MAILCLIEEILEEYLPVMARFPIKPETKNELMAILQDGRNTELIDPSRHFEAVREEPWR